MQTKKHRWYGFLRFAGLVFLLAGLAFEVVGIVSFVTALSGEGPARLFWCAFVGMPLLLIGGAMCMVGFTRALAR